MITRFNIRAYAIIVDERDRVLLSDEFQLGMKMTKFPGGGLEFGEGTIDCLKREALEEFGQAIEVLEHFYTTDFFQQGYFRTDTQIISVYYLARFCKKPVFKISDKPFDFDVMQEGEQSFRWQSVNDLKIEDITLPIDKHVAKLLKEQFSTHNP